ncbi:MAG TPA: hypothetical protein VMM92_06815 [Thermoanaerobaculia bacterium]|nr:hypothetical protein [Thermoanaerobaculia bacterium]
MSAGKILAYDGECSLCERASALVLRVFPGNARRPLQDFSGETAARLEAAGIRNEMAVIEARTGEIRSGVASLLWLLEESLAARFPGSRVAGLARRLGRPPFLPILTVLYRLIAYNRRVLAPPRGRTARFRCACDPEDHPGYQLGLIVLLCGTALALTALFGAAVARGTGLAAAETGAFQMVIAAGSGWVLLFAATAALPAAVRLSFGGHLGMVMVEGLLVLLPSMLLSLLISGPPLAGLFALSVCASFLWMLASLRRRLRWLGLSLSWLAGWVAALWTGALGAVWFFYFRQGLS